MLDVLQFLKLSNDNVHFWQYSSDVYDFQSSVEYSDSLVIVGYRSGYRSPYLPYEVRDEIRLFVENGGNLVSVPSKRAPETDGKKNTLVYSTSQVRGFLLKNIFYQPIFYGLGEINIDLSRYDNPKNLLNLQGYDFQSNLATNTKFALAYEPNRILPFLPSTFGAEYTIISDPENGLQYCPYTWTYFKYFEYGYYYDNYCAVWSKSYGDGHITILSNTFQDVGAGFRSTYLQEEPWVRVLHIGLDPSLSLPTLTLSATPTPSMSPTPPSESPSTTPSNSPTVTPSNTPFVTPSNTPTNTPSSSLSIAPSNTPTITPSISPTGTQSNTPTNTQSNTPSITPTPSATPTTTLFTETSTPSVFPSKSSSVPTQTPSPTLQVLEEKVVIDDFSISQEVSILSYYSDGDYQFKYTTEIGPTSSIIGGERDMSIIVFPSNEGELYRSNVGSSPLPFFGWTIETPSSAISTFTNQYDGSDDSFSLDITGLNIDLSDKTHLTLYTYGSIDSSVVNMYAYLYDNEGGFCSTFIPIIASADFYSDTKISIPFAGFTGSCGPVIGAIELLVEIEGLATVFVGRVSLDGPPTPPTPSSTNSPSPTTSKTFIMPSSAPTQTASPTNSPSPTSSRSPSETSSQTNSKSPLHTASTTTSISSSKTPSSTSTPTNTQTSTVSLSAGSLFTPSQTRTPSGSITPSATASTTQSGTPATQVTNSATVTSLPSKSQTPAQTVQVESKSPTPSHSSSPTITIESPFNPGSGGDQNDFDVCERTETKSEIIFTISKQTILLTKNNEVVGYLTIPVETFDSPIFVQTCADTTTDVIINNDNLTNDKGELGTIVVDITMQDTFGNLITQFDVPIEICLLQTEIFVSI